MGQSGPWRRVPESLHDAYMATDFSRKLRALVFLLPILVAACSEKPMAWIRADGRQTDAGLAQLKEIDTLACKGDPTANKKKTDSAISSLLRPTKTNDDGFSACMAELGYLRVPASEASASPK
jgi:hypothetical protein